MRARLRRSARRDAERARLHDFNNLLSELVFATQLEDKNLIQGYCEELRALYRSAADGKLTP